MTHARSAIFKTLRLLTLASAFVTLASHADEYGDVSQLLRANKFPEAMSMVDGFLASKPGDPQMRFLKGVIQRNMGRQVEAIATFSKLTEDYPELPEPYNNLAVLYAGQGQYDKARAALEMAIRTNPSYATAHENIGDVYARLASQAYNKALQLDGSNPAVPPKLALIREIFKPNLPPRTGASGAAPSPSPTPPATTPTVAVAPVPAAVKPTPVVVASAVKPAPAVAVSATKPAAMASTVVSAAKPAVVASPAVSAAKPASVAAPTPVPVDSDADAAKPVEAALAAWAKAWEAKEIHTYLKAYGPQFTPAGNASRAAWEKERTARIVGKSHINVDISELKIQVNGDKAVAKFRQAYKADTLAVSSRKTMDFQKVGNRWLITRESTGN